MTLGIPTLFLHNIYALVSKPGQTITQKALSSFVAGRAQFRSLCWPKGGHIYALGLDSEKTEKR